MPPPVPARYQEHEPSPPLAPFVACYWTLRGSAGPARERTTRAVLPDACMDILFNLAGHAEAGSTASRVIGTMTAPVPVREAGVLDLLAVRFRPGGAAPFLRFPAHEVTDRTLDLRDVWGQDGHVLWHRLGELAGTEARLRTLDQALLARLEDAHVRADDVVLNAMGMAERATGTASVSVLAERAGLGHRQLERRFLAAVGIPPKTASRVLRFQAALTLLRGSPTTSLAQVALEAGYHDQAHFTRDFKALAGIPPGSYRRALVDDAPP